MASGAQETTPGKPSPISRGVRHIKKPKPGVPKATALARPGLDIVIWPACPASGQTVAMEISRILNAPISRSNDLLEAVEEASVLVTIVDRSFPAPTDQRNFGHRLQFNTIDQTKSSDGNKDHAPGITGPRNWIFEAVRQVRFKMGNGFGRLAAQQSVSTELGRPIEELQSWERELVKSSDIENALLCAEIAGELGDYLLSGHFANVPNYKSYGHYEDKTNVERAALAFRDLQRMNLAEIRMGLRAYRVNPYR